MKRFAVISLVFALSACLMAGCRRNDMGSSNESSKPSGSTGTSQSTSLPMPDINTTMTDGMDGITGTEDATPRSPIPGMGR